MFLMWLGSELERLMEEGTAHTAVRLSVGTLSR
jgi:hypothetical protein